MGIGLGWVDKAVRRKVVDHVMDVMKANIHSLIAIDMTERRNPITNHDDESGPRRNELASVQPKAGKGGRRSIVITLSSSGS